MKIPDTYLDTLLMLIHEFLIAVNEPDQRLKKIEELFNYIEHMRDLDI